MRLKSVWMGALAALIGAAVFVPFADAADLGGRDRYSLKDEPIDGPPRYLWTGLYVGLHAGYAWGESRLTDAGGITTGNFDIDGFAGGGTLGYNFQSGQVVWGNRN